jgi:hypothetical protein
VVRLAPGRGSLFPGRWCRCTSSYWYDGTIDPHPAAGPAALLPADGTPEGITGRVRHRRGGDEPLHPRAHLRRAGSRHRRDEKPAGSASRADCFSGIRFHCDRCCRLVRPLAILNGSARLGTCSRGRGTTRVRRSWPATAGQASTSASAMRLTLVRGCSCSASTCCTAATGEVVTSEVLFVDLVVRSGRRSNTLRPACGRGVIFAGHNDLRAPVAQPDRAAAF